MRQQWEGCPPELCNLRFLLLSLNMLGLDKVGFPDGLFGDLQQGAFRPLQNAIWEGVGMEGRRGRVPASGVRSDSLCQYHLGQ